jgi:hypothetical protein
MVISRASTTIPDTLVREGRIDFLLNKRLLSPVRPSKHFLGCITRNVLTIVQARNRKADESLKNITLSLEDYLSIQEWDDPDERLKQIILKNFERAHYTIQSRLIRLQKFLLCVIFGKQCQLKGYT